MVKGFRRDQSKASLSRPTNIAYMGTDVSGAICDGHGHACNEHSDNSVHTRVHCCLTFSIDTALRGGSITCVQHHCYLLPRHARLLVQRRCVH
jgi:hypothetical protein